jgi:hypothetical protein
LFWIISPRHELNGVSSEPKLFMWWHV